MVAPGSLQPIHPDEYYRNDAAYFYALADALKAEYKAIVDTGILVQIDDAFLPYEYDRRASEMSGPEFRKWAELSVDALNHALSGIPEEMVRYHICWGSWNGPHTNDVPLRDIVDIVLKVKAQAYSIEAANPAHEHEWKVWEDVKLPEGKILIPGVICHTTNVVEHPEAVAQRIARFANVVGRENVIAGTDCGFRMRTHPQIAWAKLGALAKGAALASKELWSKR